MLPFLGNLIEKHPVIVILIVIMITIGFSLFIPRIEFKTDFEDFTPEDDIVQANIRVQEYFGENQQLIFIYATKDHSPHVLTTESIREIDYIQKVLKKNPNVDDSYSIITFLDMICYIEFGASIENCTDNQIQIALQDLLTNYSNNEITLLSSTDPNEEIDFKPYPLISKGRSIDSADIKNCNIKEVDDKIIFSIEVHDLNDLTDSIKPVFPRINVMEWYISFSNQIILVEEMNISYKISAHIEPEDDLWIIGDGIIPNIRNILMQIGNRNLLNSYSKEVYLWIRPSGQSYSIPIKMDTGNISFHKNTNHINISVSLKELSTYGISPQFGSVSLPAKLSDFNVGSRYYQTSFLHLPGGRISTNTGELINRLFRLHSRPLLGKLSESLIRKIGINSWEEFEAYYDMLDSSEMIPDTIALKDIESNWIQADLAPDDSNITDISFPIIPAFYKDLQLSIKSFLSTDFDRNEKPSSTLIFLELVPTLDYDEIISMNTEIKQQIKVVDQQYSSIKTRATGVGINSVEINELTTDANQFIAPLIFLIIVVVLFINFRRVSYVILPMLSLVISMIWLFGAMSLLGITFNVIAIALVPLILGLGVDYSVHLFHNYRIELLNGRTPGEAIKNSVTEIGTAMFLAMITTVIAFLSFLSASIPPLREFGILLALGVIFTFITSITILASLRFLLDTRFTVKIKKHTEGLAVQKIMRIISEKVLCHQRIILIIMILISVIYTIGASQIETGYSMDQFAPTDTPSFELYDIIYEQFPYSSQTQNYILLEGNIATVEALKGIKNTHTNLMNDKYVARNKDGSLKVTSIYTYIEQLVENNESIITRFHLNPKTLIPDKDSDVKALFDYLYTPIDQVSYSFDDLSSDMIKSIDPTMISVDFINGEIKTVLYKEGNRYTASLIRIYLSSTFASIERNVNEELEVLKQDIAGDLASYGSAVGTITGTNLINYEITTNLTESQILSTIISIILAAIVLMVVYRNVNLGVIALIPVGISIVWILGTMYFIGYSLNVLTITVTSITIGIGIDYAIHATERFRFIVDRTGDITKAVCETISHTGGALLIAALTTALGFIILVFAPIPPQQQFGLILSITILYSFLASIFLLPLVLYHWAKRRKKKYGYVISPNVYH
jgi:predicted RND superfamily exporter protein